jgi:hypothetical protein
MYKEYLQKLENLKGKELKGTELKSKRIELGLAQDLEKAVKKSEGLVKQSKKHTQRMEKVFKSYNDLHQKIITFSDELQKQITWNGWKMKDAKTAAKQLGINEKDIKSISVLESANKDLSREINILKYPAIR